MSETIIARRYAEALLNLAEKAGQIEDVAQGLDDVAGVIDASPRLREVLVSPQVSEDERRKVIGELLERAQVPELVDKFVRFLAHKYRTPLLLDVQRVFHELADARLGRAQAQLTVAAPLSEAEQERLQELYERLSGRKISLSVTVDPDILGGAVTRIGSTVWDGSLRNALYSMRNAITQG